MVHAAVARLSPAAPALVALGNGVRVVAIPLPHAETAAVSVFVRSGSAHESRRLNGISHVVEHMAFKGTATRSVQQINFDAERLGADVNAHTDKDHTAYHMRGRARDAGAFVSMLGEIVLASTFPEAELERERQVLLSEMADEEDDALAIVDKLFDRLSFGDHPIAQPIVGSALNVRRISRDDILGYVAAQYTGPNVIVGVAGQVDVDAFARAAEAAFGAMRGGTANAVAPAAWHGGAASKAQGGSQQSHVVLGYGGVPVTDPAHHAIAVAAAVFGDGMSSPLLDQIRERRGLAYSLGCAAEASSLAGSFVIDASLAPEHLDEFLAETKAAARGARRPRRRGLSRPRQEPARGAAPARRRESRAPSRARRARHLRLRPRTQPRRARRRGRGRRRRRRARHLRAPAREPGVARARRQAAQGRRRAGARRVRGRLTPAAGSAARTAASAARSLPPVVHSAASRRRALQEHPMSKQHQGEATDQALAGKRVAFLVDDGFGAGRAVRSPQRHHRRPAPRPMSCRRKTGRVKGWNHTAWGEQVKVGRSRCRRRRSTTTTHSCCRAA